MRFIIDTENGVQYDLNSENMEWVRYNPLRGSFYEAGRGTLAQWPTVVMNERMYLPIIDEDAPTGVDVIVSNSPVVDFNVVED